MQHSMFQRIGPSILPIIPVFQTAVIITLKPIGLSLYTSNMIGSVPATSPQSDPNAAIYIPVERSAPKTGSINGTR